MTGAPHIRFYAGAPLVTSNGMRLGSLCVIDKEPRHLDAEQLMVLANFAEVVVREIEKDIARVSHLTYRWCHRGTASCHCCCQFDRAVLLVFVWGVFYIVTPGSISVCPRNACMIAAGKEACIAMSPAHY